MQVVEEHSTTKSPVAGEVTENPVESELADYAIAEFDVLRIWTDTELIISMDIGYLNPVPVQLKS